ncbi:glycosyltransferase [Cupriavidus basilensis]|uniref:Glycosyltransferase n=1 Tax=Cupriavidus basilensis TaxID=68895 RepID=A0ABT6B3M1_9BURK|nr:glycosyltransferase [Cupriavidus basilensis]MDF3839479.1 glycosyltransferase [Cupriavidus basilensis]
MRILHLANHARDTGNGMVNLMVDLACAQAASGHEVTIAAEACGFEALLCKYGVRFAVLPQRRPWALPRAVRGLRALVREFAPDIVHTHMAAGTLVACLARLGRARAARYPLVTTMHGEFQRSNQLMRMGDRVVAVSGAVGGNLRRSGLPAERVAVVRNATLGSPRQAQRPPAPAIELAAPSIVTVSGMYGRKGIFDLVVAFADVRRAVPGAHLYCVGDGPDRLACAGLAATLGVADAVHFPGFVADPRPYLHAADMFVLASHSDAFPLALSEAREAGCAVIGTAVGGIPEVLEFGAAGQLVPVCQPELLAQAMTGLLKNPAALADWRRRARAGIGWLEVARMNRDYLEVYRELLQPSAGATHDAMARRAEAGAK